jgi:hypothetical protein
MTLYGMLVLIWMEKVQVYQKVQIKNLTEFIPKSKKFKVNHQKLCSKQNRLQILPIAK